MRRLLGFSTRYELDGFLKAHEVWADTPLKTCTAKSKTFKVWDSEASADRRCRYARKAGLRYHVDLHLEVDGAMTVRQSHELAHKVKLHVMQTLDWVADVLVHVEPRSRARRIRRPHRNSNSGAAVKDQDPSMGN